MTFVGYMLKFILLLLFVSCSSQTTVKFTSVPDKADLYVQDMVSKVETKIGVTPYIASGEKLNSLHIENGFTRIIMRKEGYKENKVILADVQGSSFNIFLKLKPTSKLSDAKIYDKLSIDLFEVQRLIREQNYSKALVKLNKLNDDFPELSIPLELIGSIYFFKKQYKKSYDFFTRSYYKNPDNSFSLRMKNILTSKLGRK